MAVFLTAYPHKWWHCEQCGALHQGTRQEYSCCPTCGLLEPDDDRVICSGGGQRPQESELYLHKELRLACSGGAYPWQESKLRLNDVKQTQGPYISRFNDFSEALVPPSHDAELGASAIKAVVRSLQKLTNMDRVHKGGSFGRATHVGGRDCFDVDLLVFLNDFDPADEQGVESMLLRAAERLVERTGCTVTKRKPRLQMLRLELRGVQMDVLFVRNVATHADPDKAAAQRRELVEPLFPMKKYEIAAMAARPPDRARERAVSEALTEFVKRQHGIANSAVRLFKAWVKVGLAEGGLLKSKKLPSVALELIVLAAYQSEEHRLGTMTAFPHIGETRSLLVRVFLTSLELATRLLDSSTLIMLDAGAQLGYVRDQGKRFRPCWGGEPPYVIHPIDPTCNVARAPDNSALPSWHCDYKPPWDWAGLAREARTLLDTLHDSSMHVLLRESTLGDALDRLKCRRMARGPAQGAAKGSPLLAGTWERSGTADAAGGGAMSAGAAGQGLPLLRHESTFGAALGRPAPSGPAQGAAESPQRGSSQKRHGSADCTDAAEGGEASASEAGQLLLLALGLAVVGVGACAAVSYGLPRPAPRAPEWQHRSSWRWALCAAAAGGVFVYFCPGFAVGLCAVAAIAGAIRAQM